MVNIGEIKFKTQELAKKYVREIISSYSNGMVITNPAHHKIFTDLVQRHSDKEEKIGPGVKYFISHRGWNGSLAVNIKRIDGTVVDFSWVHCITGRKKNELDDAMRLAIEDQVLEFKDQIVSYICGICNQSVDGEINIDHVIPFNILKKEFLKITANHPKEFDDHKSNRAMFKPMDIEFERSWSLFHKERAVLRLTHRVCNQKRRL